MPVMEPPAGFLSWAENQQTLTDLDWHNLCLAAPSDVPRVAKSHRTVAWPCEARALSEAPVTVSPALSCRSSQCSLNENAGRTRGNRSKYSCVGRLPFYANTHMAEPGPKTVIRINHYFGSSVGTQNQSHVPLRLASVRMYRYGRAAGSGHDPGLD